MLLGGIEVEYSEVQRLADVVRHKALSQKLTLAVRLRWPVLNLTIAERHTILAVLDDDPPAELERLRDCLLESPAWQLRERL